MYLWMRVSKSKNQIKNILFPPDCDINEHKLLPVAPTVTRSLTASATANLVYMPSLQTSLTTVPRSMLASLPVDWSVWIGSCVLLSA